MRSALIGLVLAGLLGWGGWHYARNAGWIAGKPNSPRAENFKRALEAYLPRLVDPGKRPCVPLGFYPPHLRTFPDTGFGWTPATFRAVMDDSAVGRRGLFPILAKHGYLEKSADGPVYTMTWKGYAASNGAGCFYLGGIDYDVKVNAFTKSRQEVGGMQVYEVIAQPALRSLEPWALDPEFAALGETERVRILTSPAPVTYELGQTATGFVVLGEKGGKPWNPPVASAKEAPPPEAVSAERVKEAIVAFLAIGGGIRNPVCLMLPYSGADEVTYDAAATPGRAPRPAGFTIHNWPGRDARQQSAALRAYELLSRLQSAGLARSEFGAGGPFKRGTSLGHVRFELTEGAKALLWDSHPACILLGTAEIDQVLVIDRFSEAAPRPRFVARARLKMREGIAPLAERFGHIGRLADPGIVVQGILTHADGKPSVASLGQIGAEFTPDLSGKQLPVVEGAPAPKPPAAAAVPARAPARGTPTPARPGPNERVIRCGGDVIVCDPSDTVICRGRVVPCR